MIFRSIWNLFFPDKHIVEKEERLDRNLKDLSKAIDALDKIQHNVKAMRSSITNEAELRPNE